MDAFIEASKAAADIVKEKRPDAVFCVTVTGALTINHELEAISAGTGGGYVGPDPSTGIIKGVGPENFGRVFGQVAGHAIRSIAAFKNVDESEKWVAIVEAIEEFKRIVMAMVSENTNFVASTDSEEGREKVRKLASSFGFLESEMSEDEVKKIFDPDHDSLDPA